MKSTLALSLLMMFLPGCQLAMPGRSHTGPLPAMTTRQHELAANLRAHVEMLATRIGERNLNHYAQLESAAKYLQSTLTDFGYTPTAQLYTVGQFPVRNIEAEIKGTKHPEQIILIGAHYDSAEGAPAANDNGSGVAAVLEIARSMRHARPDRTLRFVLFVNEEPPYFQTEQMGSMVYAKRCRDRGEDIVAMLTPETIGCYSDEKGSQHYPFPFNLLYPDTGNFIAFVGNFNSRDLVGRCVGAFRRTTAFPSEGAAVPASIEGVGWSDHWSFWQYGYPGMMVTDTAPFRYHHYHTPEDTPDKIDFDRMARVVEGLERVVEELAGVNGPAK